MLVARGFCAFVCMQNSSVVALPIACILLDIRAPVPIVHDIVATQNVGEVLVVLDAIVRLATRLNRSPTATASTESDPTRALLRKGFGELAVPCCC